MNKTYEVPERKVCKRCGLEKDVKDFNLHHARIKGNSKYRGECKACVKLWRKENSEKLKLKAKLYNKTHSEQIKEKKRQYLSDPVNLEKNRLYAREYGRKYPERQRNRLFQKYGITAQQYDDMLLKQDNCCAICGTKKNGKKKNFIIDHCHHSKKVRGLLCTQCNAGLGNFKDNPLFLSSAIGYLTR